MAVPCCAAKESILLRAAATVPVAVERPQARRRWRCSAAKCDGGIERFHLRAAT